MKKFLTWIGAVAVMTCIALPGYAQEEDISDESSDMTIDSETGTEGGMTDVTSEALRAPSPRLRDPDRAGFFQVGTGPGFGIGMDADNVMWNVIGSYNRNINDNWSAKGLVDAYLGTGDDAARMINVEVGADYYLTQLGFRRTLPYIAGDVGWGFARNSDTDNTENAPVIGVGTGLKFIAADLNWDVNAHYSVLTNELDDTVPSVFGLRASVNF